MKKILMIVILCLTLILQNTFVFAQVNTADEVITTFTTTIADEKLRLFVFAEPEVDIGIEIVKSNAQLLPQATNKQTFLDTFANVGQITTDFAGTGHYDFAIKNPGTYTVRYSTRILKSLLYNQPKNEFFAFTWPTYDTGFYNIVNMTQYNLCQQIVDNGVAVAVKDVSNYTKSMPKGKKTVYFDVYHFKYFLEKDLEDYIYYDAGADFLNTRLSEFFKAYKEAGHGFDYIVMDTEQVLWDDELNNLDAEKYKAITQNDKWPQLRQQLEERGFEFCSDPELGELYYLVDSTNSSVSGLSYIWKVVFFNHMADYVTHAVYDAAVKYFPDIKMGNWENMDLNSWYKIPAHGGQQFYRGGNYTKSGTHSTLEAYGETAYVVDAVPELLTKTKFEGVPFNVMLMGVNRAKAVYLSDKEKKLQFWIGSSNYRSGIEGYNYTLANTPYYAEQVFHLGMLNPDPFLYFNPTEGPNADRDVHMGEAYKLSMLLEELSAVSPSANRRTITPEYPNWNKRYLISGMTDGNKNIWRITPDLSVDGVTLESFLIDTTTPTFCIEGRTITFSEGRVLENVGFENDTCGYWVETPANVYPTETTDKDMALISPVIYADFESFRSYELPIAFDDTKYHPGVIDRTFWPTSGAFIAQYDGENVVLAMQGGNDARLDFAFHSQRVSVFGKNKEKQIWEVKFKLPKATSLKTENTYILGFDGSNVSGDQDYLENSALHIEDGFWGKNTLYCVDNGKQTSIAELSSGKWYTVTRKMDFSGEFVKSDVYLYDENGSLVASREGIVGEEVRFPISDVFFYTEDYGNGKNLLLDDFKICLTGLDIAFEVYDQYTGMLLNEISSDNGMVALVNYNNADDEDVEYVLLHASYENDKLSYMEILSDGVFAAGADGNLCFEISDKRKPGTKDKFFLLDSLGNLVPLKPSIDITNK